MNDSTQRFSNRVENYVKYRPTYPPAVVDLLREECGLSGESVIADAGSGTGILAELFLKNGTRVFGIEPNREMREAGERLLRDYDRFQSVGGTAEATTLADHSVDFVTAGQAFHWFNRKKAAREFARILKPDGWVVLVWNERLISTPFLVAYEQLLNDWATDYGAVNHTQINDEVLQEFFGSGGFKLGTFENHQVFDHESLRGRFLSSSYVPEAGHPNHNKALDDLQAIFEAHQVEGKVVFEYDTKVYYGRLPTTA